MYAVWAGMDALKRHVPPVELVPTFLMVNLTAGSFPFGTVDVAMNESVEVDWRYPMASMVTIRSERPERVGELALPPIWYVVAVFSPAVGTGATAVLVGVVVVCVAAVVVAAVEVASPNEMVVEAVVGTTEREVGFAGVKNSDRETAATLKRPTTLGTKRAE